MLTASRLMAAVDRRLLKLIHARARRRSPILRLLPLRWLGPVLAPTARRLRVKLVTAAVVLSVLLVGVVFWLVVP